MFTALQKYAEFSGRARRQELWMFVLFQFIAFVVAGFIDGMTGTPAMTGIVGLGLLIPALSVQVRRLHDIDRSGWWIFIVLVPIIGGIALLVFNVLDGTPGPNRFGANPKA
jgi:uncharacterized membrane protein YhaH (DUF805 family)